MSYISLEVRKLDFSSDLLVENKSAREQGIDKLKAQHSEEQVLNKVKQLFFAVWKDIGRASRQQLADFYEVSVESIDSNYQRHKDEFESDGVEVLRGADLKEGKRIMRLPSSTSQETIYTSAGALRMGFILRGSEVAKTVRTIAIRFIQGVGQQLNSQVVLQGLTQSYPILKEFINQETIKVSAPLSRLSEKDRSALIKKHPLGFPYVLPKLPSVSGSSEITAHDIQDRFQLLAGYTDNFLLRGDKQLEIPLKEKKPRTRYPHLTSNVFQFNTANGVEKAVIMFHFHNIAVDYDFLQLCIGRSYLQFAKDFLGVNYAYLILVAPLGATPEAAACIKNSNHLSSDYKDCVGVLTVNELAEFLQKQALAPREEGQGTMKGKIKDKFKEFLRDPFLPEQGNFFELLEESIELKQLT